MTKKLKNKTKPYPEKRKSVLIPKYAVSHIVERHLWAEFSEIPSGRIHAFVDSTGRDGQSILESWAESLRGKFHGIKTKYKVPFVITKHPKTEVMVLWKERVA